MTSFYFHRFFKSTSSTLRNKSTRASDGSANRSLNYWAGSGHASRLIYGAELEDTAAPVYTQATNEDLLHGTRNSAPGPVGHSGREIQKGGICERARLGIMLRNGRNAHTLQSSSAPTPVRTERGAWLYLHQDSTLTPTAAPSYQASITLTRTRKLTLHKTRELCAQTRYARNIETLPLSHACGRVTGHRGDCWIFSGWISESSVEWGRAIQYCFRPDVAKSKLQTDWSSCQNNTDTGGKKVIYSLPSDRINKTTVLHNVDWHCFL